MRLIVTAQVVPSFGEEPIWGFHHDEVVQFSKGVEHGEGTVVLAQKLLDLVDAAKASLSEQIAAEDAQP